MNKGGEEALYGDDGIFFFVSYGEDEDEPNGERTPLIELYVL